MFRAFGYVHTCYGKQDESDPVDSHCIRPEGAIQQDIDEWYEFYPMINGIFFDEVSIHPDLVTYYQGLYDYVQERPSAIVVFNSGMEPHQDYFNIGSSILCTFEGPFPNFGGWWPPDWVTRAHSCVLVYDTSSSDLPAALKRLSEVEIGCFYFTSDTNGILNPWDTLPPYFQNLANSVSCVYLPVVLKNHPRSLVVYGGRDSVACLLFQNTAR